MPQKRIARYRRNLKYALFPSLLLCFLYIVWGPMEVYMGNAAAFRFEYLDILLPLLGLAAACSLAPPPTVSILIPIVMPPAAPAPR